MDKYLVRGRRVDNGEWVEGQRCTDGNRIWIVYDNDFYPSPVPGGDALLSDRFLEVDPATVEPVARKVKREKTCVGDYRCPTCNVAFVECAGTTPYCGNCGQRLDWRVM